MCKNPLTIGVAYRVEQLADRKTPENVPPFYEVIPLTELIASFTGVKQLASKKTWEIYNLLTKKFGSEYNILLDVPFEDLGKIVDKKLAELIILNRENKLKITPGYDGVYGKVVFNGDSPTLKRAHAEQKSITEF